MAKAQWYLWRGVWADLGEMVEGWAGSAEWVGGGRGGTDLSEGFGPGGAKEVFQLGGGWQLGR